MILNFLKMENLILNGIKMLSNSLIVLGLHDKDFLISLINTVFLHDL